MLFLFCALAAVALARACRHVDGARLRVNAAYLRAHSEAGFHFGFRKIRSSENKNTGEHLVQDTGGVRRRL